MSHAGCFDPVIDFLPGRVARLESAGDLVEADPGAVEGVGYLRDRAGTAVGEPFAGHLGPVAYFVEGLVVHGSHGLEIEDDDRNFSPLDHGQDGGTQRIGGDVEEDDVHVRSPHGMTGLHGFFRGIDEAEVADLNTGTGDLVGHLAEVAFQSWF